IGLTNDTKSGSPARVFGSSGSIATGPGTTRTSRGFPRQTPRRAPRGSTACPLGVRWKSVPIPYSFSHRITRMESRSTSNTRTVIQVAVHPGEREIMNRRDVLIAGGWALSGTALAAAAEQKQSADTHSAHMEHYVKSLTDCLRECESCSDHCSRLVAS